MMFEPSTDNQEFSTGAVRGNSTGRGKASLLPLGAVSLLAEFFGGWNQLPVRAIDAVCKLYEAGAQKYSARNWERGIPLENYIDSTWRHFMKRVLGEQDEPHSVQFAWNILCLLQTHLWIAETRLPQSLNTFPSVDTFQPFPKIPRLVEWGTCETADDFANETWEYLRRYECGETVAIIGAAACALMMLDKDLQSAT